MFASAVLLAFVPAAEAAASLSVSPSAQSVGGTVTVGGNGFAASSPVTVSFDGSTVATTTSDPLGNLPSGVTFTVPAAAGGSHTVSATDGTNSPTSPLTVESSISLTPSGQSVGGTVTVGGSGFAASSPVTVSFDGSTVATPTADSNGSLPSGVTFTVPAATVGSHTVSATDGTNSANSPLNVLSSISLMPGAQSVGGTVTVGGSGFAASAPVTVSFDGNTVATTTSNSNGSLPSGVTFTVPAATVGSHTVSATDGTNSASTPVNVDSVSITPSSGPAGSGLTVTGAGWPEHDVIRVQIGGSTVCQLGASTGGDISGDQMNGCSVPTGLLSGPYPITAIDTDGSAQATATSDFTVPGPMASFTPSSTAVPTGTPVTFNDTSTDAYGTIDNWHWGFGDGGSSTSSQPTYTYVTPGTYTVTLQVSDSAGNIGEASGQVTVTPRPPTAAFNPTSATVLAGSSVAFDGTQSSDPNGGGLSYSWNFGDGGTATGSQPSHTYATPGTYNVTLSLSDTYRQTSSVTHQITVIAPPPVQTLIVTPVAKPAIIKGGRVSATRSGIIELAERLFCPGPGPGCTAYIVATSRSLLHAAADARVRHRAIAANVTVSIAPNGSAAVKFKLSRRAFAYLRKHHRLPIRVKITLVRGQQTRTSTVSLLLVR